MRLALSTALASTLLAGAAGAGALPADPAEHPPALRNLVEERAAECREAGSRLIVGSYAEEAELNGDERPDYIIENVLLACPAFGAGGGHCGSAGCSVEFFLSGPAGLTHVGGGQFQGRALTNLPDGRQAITFAAHGTACGKQFGAETCFGTMSWNSGRFVTRWQRTAPPELDAIMVGEEQRPLETRWSVMARQDGAPVARYEGLPELPGIRIGCTQGRVALLVENAAPHLAGRPFLLRLAGEPTPDDPDVQPDLLLLPIPGAQAHVGFMPPALHARLQQREFKEQGWIDGKPAGNFGEPVEWSLSEGSYWVSVPRWISLAGYSEATAPVFAACGPGN